MTKSPPSYSNKSGKQKQQKPRTPVNMRAAHILATALVVANARPKWRADRAMLPALATLPRYPTNHTQPHTPQQHAHALASQMAEWPDGCLTQHATQARNAHHRAATTSLSTLQHSAAKFPRIFRPCAAPARQPMLCCAAPHLCKPLFSLTRVQQTVSCPAAARGALREGCVFNV